ncbi:MAG: hypothetical protein ACOZIN_08305 [Myxococcota bacterium]
MIYEELERSNQRVLFRTHAKARRGRGVLFATAPWVVYLLLVAVLFVLAAQDLSLWERAKQLMRIGAATAAGLAAICFILGRRIRDVVDADQQRLRLEHTPALGATRELELRYAELSAFAIEPSLRSLGADILFVAVHKDGRHLPIAEGEPHTAQVRELARDISTLAKLPLESAKLSTA